MTWPETLAAVAVGWALLQLILASRRDLGPITIGLGGSAILLAEATAGTARFAAFLLVAVAVAALAWARASRHAVGHASMNGIALFAAVVAGLLPWWLPTVAPTVDVARAAQIAIGPSLLVASMAGVVALDRKGPRRECPRYWRKVPVAYGPA